MAQQQVINPAFIFWDMWMTSQRNYIQMWQRVFQPRRELVPFGRYQAEGQHAVVVPRVASEAGEQVIPIGEESLDVTTRRIEGATTWVRRVVRGQPVDGH